MLLVDFSTDQGYFYNNLSLHLHFVLIPKPLSRARCFQTNISYSGEDFSVWLCPGEFWDILYHHGCLCEDLLYKIPSL